MSKLTQYQLADFPVGEYKEAMEGDNGGPPLDPTEDSRTEIMQLDEETILKEMRKLQMADLMARLKAGQVDYRDHAVIAKILKDNGFNLIPPKTAEEERAIEEREAVPLPTEFPTDDED